MTEGVTATIQTRVTAMLTSPPPLGDAAQNVNQLSQIALAAGTGLGNADTLLTVDLDIAASGNVILDVNGVGDQDAFGEDIAMADVQAIFITADPGNTNNLKVGNAGSEPFLGPLAGDGNVTVSIKPGGVFLYADPAGWATNAGSAHNLEIANSGSGSAVKGTVVLIGRSA